MSVPTKRVGKARFSRLLYRRLLLAYPRDFRAEHGDDAVDVFDDLARATIRRGRLPLVGLWASSVGEVIRGGIAERRQPSPPDAAKPRRLRPARLDTIGRELHHAVRALLRRPAFALAAVPTLALGIGATTAVFSVVDTVLLRPLPFPRSEELVTVSHVVPGIASGEWRLSRAGYFYFQRHAETLQGIGVYRSGSMVLTGDGPPERLGVTRITASLLTTVGVNPAIGRPFTREDDLPGAAPMAIVSHGFWLRHFGAEPDVVGATLNLSGTRYEVIGVMPGEFRFPSPQTDVWTAIGFDPAAPPVNQHIYFGIARARSGIAPDEVLTELESLVGRFAEEMPEAYGGGFMERSGFRVVVRGLLEDTVGNARVLLWIVLAAAALVLAIAIANVANLTMLRSEARRREVALRAALGAGRGALLRYALSEAALVAVAGGVLGVGIAWVGVRLLVLAAPAGLSRTDEIALRPMAAGVAVAAVAAVVCVLGTVSALRGRTRLADQLRSGGRAGSADRRGMRLRGAFVVTQVCMAVLLMAGSGVLLRSFMNLRGVDPGFSPDNVLTLQLSLSPDKYEDGAAAFRFFEEVSERLRGLPGVIAVGVVDELPLVSDAADNINGFADLPDGSEQNLVTDTKFAGPGYLEALGMRLITGRTLERRDMQAETPGAVVTRALAEEMWPGQSAVGKRVRPLLRDYPWHTVVGVVDDVRVEDFTRAPEPTVYFPYADLSWGRTFNFAIRTEGPPEPLLPAVRREVWALDADVPLAAVATMDELVADHLSRTTFTLTLVGVAATMALFLCAVGIYGVIAYSVSQRYFEIGVRMALGARGPEVAGMVLRQTMVLTAVGVVAGVGLAFVGMGLMESLLFEVAPTDPATLAAVAIGLLMVAGLAGALPARRATRVDAIVALHGE